MKFHSWLFSTSALAVVLLISFVECHIIILQLSTNQSMEEFYDLPAQFGATLPSDSGAKFLAVASDPRFGCSELVPPPVTTNPDDKFVAVIQRSNCTFETKVRNAQKAGYDAAIVYNLNSEDLEQMSAKNANDIKIPAVFVGERTGIYIIEGYDYNSGFCLLINNESPFDINKHLILPFSILIGLCFIIMIFYMIYKCVREQRRLRQHRLPKRLLKQIPTTKFTKGQPYETCVICLDEFVEGDKLRILMCSHAYHSVCIDPWLTKNRRVCPICKRKVFARGEARTTRRRQVSSDSMSDSDDDTAPLMTADGNANNHGTFSPNRSAASANDAALQVENPTSDEENVLLSDQPRRNQRINPFDRSPNLPPNLASELNRSRSFWSLNIFRMFRRQAAVNSGNTYQRITPVNEGISTTLTSTSSASQPTQSGSVDLPPRAASNNVLNTNLSGSFKDDDETEATQSIYEPIAAAGHRVDDSDSAFIQTPTRGGIGVVALPNPNLPASRGGGHHFV